MGKVTRLSALVAMCFIAGCASIPTGPSMMALPGTGRSFEQFRYDDYYCRQFAYDTSGAVTPNNAAITSGAGTAAVGAGLGAAAGALLGGGHGAAIGAGTGLIAGSLAGINTASASGNISQQRYDASYIQCMYGKGHRVPVYGQVPAQTPGGAYANSYSPYANDANGYNRYPPYPQGQQRSLPPPPPPPPGIPPPPPPR
ncbi:MAG: hypothetical protein BGO99_10210 [Nitrosospira sp. 56-18]|jgi:hypothetical protein|nr:MAG: hypothetical protein BGO99_10210 [Nitrosospira sp. 56-18]